MRVDVRLNGHCIDKSFHRMDEDLRRIILAAVLIMNNRVGE